MGVDHKLATQRSFADDGVTEKRWVYRGRSAVNRRSCRFYKRQSHRCRRRHAKVELLREQQDQTQVVKDEINDPS